MKFKKGAVTGLAVVIIIVAGITAVIVYQKNAERSALANRIFSMGGSAQAASVADLKASITKYEGRIARHIRDAVQTGAYWKILAVRLQDSGLHGEALGALEHAIYYTPEDPALHYYTGVSAGIVAKSLHLFPGTENNDRKRYFDLAEDAYLRAIELDNRYMRPLYGLGVLYVFELDRPADAIPYLERCLVLSRNDVDTMFVLARAHFILRNYQTAIDLYDRIITLTRDEQKRREAQENRQFILGQMHG